VDESWLSVTEAAERLQVSTAHVRRLIGEGDLPAARMAGAWFIDPATIARRQQRAARPGRALNPSVAWRLLLLLNQRGQTLAGVPAEDDGHAWEGLSDVQRHRLRSLLADLPDGPVLASLLRGRAQRQLMRAHPGVLDRLAVDGRVRPGAGRAAAARGAGLAAGGRELLYISAADVADVRDQYRLQPDPAGNVELAVIPAAVPDELMPAPGEPVPLSVAWVDLLEDPDARASQAARDWVNRMRSVAASAAAR
jgi:excisionase family DNA binding protein